MDGPSSPRRRLAGPSFFLKVGISVGLLALVFRSIDVRAMLRELGGVDPWWVALGVFLATFQALISTWKWQLILRADGHLLRYWLLFKVLKIGGFLSLFLPTSFGGDVYRAWALNRRGVRMSKSAASVLFDRLSGLFALLTIGVVGSALLLDPIHAATLVTVYLTGVGLFLVVTGDAVTARLPDSGSRYLDFPFRLIRSFNRYRHRRSTFLATLLLSAGFQFNSVLIVTCYARALDVGAAEVSFLEMVAVVPLVFLSEVLPSINGIGVRDGAFVFLFQLVGTTSEKALAVSILVLLVRNLLALTGAPLWIHEMFKSKQVAPATDAASVQRATH